jgi:APA family basic amino acid/polyamine antiporter
MTFASYAAPSLARPLAVGAVLALTVVNYRGVQKTARLTRSLVAVVLAVLAAIVAAVWLGGAADSRRLWPLDDVTPYGVMQAAGLLFFAFAGYARIATLGEEVIDPERTIPRAIPLALGITLLVYALVTASALAGAGAPALAASTAPLASAVEAGRFGCMSPVVRAGATVASLGVLLSLIAGVSRTVFAMSARGDLPRWLSAVHPRYHVPHRADVSIGLVVATGAALADVRSAIGFSSFTVLTYYAVANLAAYTLAAGERRWSRAWSIVGLLGCMSLAFTLPLRSVLAGAALLAVGVAGRRATARR